MNPAADFDPQPQSRPIRMNAIRIRRALLLATLCSATLLHADDRSVFAIHGSNGFETIRGALVMNRDAVRTTTSTGYSFASPVDFLHYTISDGSGVLATFTLSAANPNVLRITKAGDGFTRFHLFVEPVPTDPPFPSPPAFEMTFSFPGDAPWGDWVPDRTIAGVTEVSLGASDLYDQSVVIAEVTLPELARQLGAANAELRRLRRLLAKGSGN